MAQKTNKCPSCVDNDEDYDTDPLYRKAEKELDGDGAWMETAALTVGMAYALKSSGPTYKNGEPVYPPLAKLLRELDPNIFINFYNLTPLESPLQTQQLSLLFESGDLQYLESLRSSLETMNLLTDPKLYPSIENLAYRDAVSNMDKMGMYGGQESWKIGQLELYKNAELQLNVVVMIPWETCETRNDCDTEGPVCEECEDLEAGGPYRPDEYPEPPHFGCRCGPGEEVFVVEDFATTPEEQKILGDGLLVIFIH